MGVGLQLCGSVCLFVLVEMHVRVCVCGGSVSVCGDVAVCGCVSVSERVRG